MYIIQDIDYNELEEKIWTYSIPDLLEKDLIYISVYCLLNRMVGFWMQL